MLNRRLLALAISVLASVIELGCTAEPVRVRVLTYNIHHGEGADGRLDLARIAAVVKRAAPDLAALQEVDSATSRSQGIDQASELGRLTGMHAAFGKAMDFDGGGYGQTVLSRLPLSDLIVHELPFTPGREPRCAISARVALAVGGPEVLFAATHLEHARAELRLHQAQALDRAMAAAGPMPAILAGDLNDAPGSAPLRILLEHWTDATADRPQPTWPADEPSSKIDYVLFRPAGSWRVIETQVLDERAASDHRPLLVVLEWVATSRSGAR